MIAAIRTPRLELVPFDPNALKHLVRGDRTQAQHIMGIQLPDEFPTPDELASFLPVQLHRMEAAPYRRDWMARLIVTRTVSTDRPT